MTYNMPALPSGSEPGPSWPLWDEHTPVRDDLFSLVPTVAESKADEEALAAIENLERAMRQSSKTRECVEALVGQLKEYPSAEVPFPCWEVANRVASLFGEAGWTVAVEQATISPTQKSSIPPVPWRLLVVRPDKAYEVMLGVACEKARRLPQCETVPSLVVKVLVAGGVGWFTDRVAQLFGSSQAAALVVVPMRVLTVGAVLGVLLAVVKLWVRRTRVVEARDPMRFTRTCDIWGDVPTNELLRQHEKGSRQDAWWVGNELINRCFQWPRSGGRGRWEADYYPDQEPLPLPVDGSQPRLRAICVAANPLDPERSHVL